MKLFFRFPSLRLLPLAAALAAATPAQASNPEEVDMATLLARIERIEAENARLKADLEELRQRGQAPAEQPAAAPVPPAPAAPSVPVPVGVVEADTARPAFGIDTSYSAAVLDHRQNVNQRQILQLEARAEGRLQPVVTVGGQIIAIGNAHWSNRPNKFGYLMRHPTGNNQRTKATQEIALHSAQLGMTITPTRSLTGYVELLYDPEQSFGAGTIVALARNQVQVRKAYVLWGDLTRSPIYVSAGKMDVPFGLQDTVSPFTNSSTWHAFAPLAYGGQIGLLKDGLSLRAMAVLGGAQFRAANTPVDGTSVPSKLNNFALDASYTHRLADQGSVMLGASYLHGTAYCQNYPVFHFNPCSDNVPAWDVYGRMKYGPVELIGEFARTTKVWPGTQVPNPVNPLSVFAASKVTAFTAGGRYHLGSPGEGTRLSLEYSKFIAGPEGSPWHRQDQTVAGIAKDFGLGAELFGEYVHTAGFAPLNFISGGNFPDGSTWSDNSARSNVVVVGARLGF